jgi:hypothetical protein
VLRIVLTALGVLFFALAFFRINARQIDRTGLCGSIVQGSTHDDGGSNTSECNRLRHRDEVTAVAFVIIGVAALGLGVGHAFYTRNR